MKSIALGDSDEDGDGKISFDEFKRSMVAALASDHQSDDASSLIQAITEKGKAKEETSMAARAISPPPAAPKEEK